MWRRGLRPGSLAAFAFAIVCVAIATAIRYAFDFVAPDILPFATHFPAILFATLVGGVSAGILALALSFVAVEMLFVPPYFALFPITPRWIADLVLFFGSAGVIVWGVEIYRRNVRRLEEAARKLEAVTDTAVDAIITIDEKGIIQSANPATEKLFGYAPAGLVGKMIGELMPQPYSSDHGIYLRNYLETGIRKVIGIGREVAGRRKDGTVFPIHLSVSEFAVDGERFFTGYVRDLTAEKEHEEEIDLLMREVTHRSRNLLSVVQALARLLARSSDSVKDFETRLTARLSALAAANDLLVKGDPLGAHIDEIVRSQLGHYKELFGKQIEANGPRVFLDRHAVQYIGLALHELSTNAAKYGALSDPNGKVLIRWELDAPDQKPKFLVMEWTERDGPLVEEPKAKGFGHMILDQIVSSALSGQVRQAFKPEGMTWRLQVPATYVIHHSRNEPEAQDLRRIPA